MRYYWLLLVTLVACGDSEPQTEDSYTTDAQYICDTLITCFALDVGEQCAPTIEATTREKDITACADCYAYASCDEIGAPGVSGVCDVACNAALFEVAQ